MESLFIVTHSSISLPMWAASRMAFFGLGSNGITLKELLEDPKLQNPPHLNQDGKFDKLKGSQSPGGLDFSSAFLGPNIWGNPGNDGDINLEYMDLDEFLSENGIPVDLEEVSNDSKNSNNNVNLKIPSPGQSPVASRTESPVSVHPVVSPQAYVPSPDITTPSSPEKSPSSPVQVVGSPSGSASPAAGINFDVSDQDLALSSAPDLYLWSSSFIEGVFRSGDIDFGIDSDNSMDKETSDDDPNDSNIKAEFIFVPEDCKDEKYWQRRKKNNVAAKRSRDARRIKENQIALRAAFLEKQTENLKDELEKMKKENQKLKAMLAKYENKS
ncbi:hypothetical protein KUTeg_024889 [Tegillarca granosa]|uniref:BZIP domain-containing protein n=1 Tax=Tegillarca granosa TaxID=220873 RepID=A0ABQ9DYL7_TEGGR|nr:hypothetical protein KUTeg_024889 [Tegillarca granosa]